MKVSLKTRVLKLTAAVPLSLPAPGHRMGERKSLDEAQAIKNTDIAEELELPPVKIHCSILAEDAIKAAIADYKSKREAK